MFGPKRQAGLIAHPLPLWHARRVAHHIDSHLAQSIKISHLARLAGCSNSHFHRAFRRRFGLTPHRYITNRRMEAAQCMLLETNYSLSRIALSCGMSDQAHFTRLFRQRIGMSPRRWRTAQRRILAGWLFVLLGLEAITN